MYLESAAFSATFSSPLLVLQELHAAEVRRNKEQREEMSG
jgi:hypothetical protein